MIRLWLKIAISAGLIAWFLSRTAINDVLVQLGNLGAGAVYAGATLSVAAWLVGAFRLWLLVPEFQLREVIRTSFISLFYATVLPGQLAGDVVKAWRLGQSQGLRGHAGAATVVDRGIAMLTLLIIGAVAAFLVPAPQALRMAFVITSIAFGAAGCLLALPSIRDMIVARFQSFDGPWATRIAGALERLASAIHDALRRPRRIALCFLLAPVFHALCVSIHVVIGVALGVHLSIAVWCMVYAGVSILLLLPFTIAGMGLREGGFVGLLSLFGVGHDVALAISFTLLGYALFGAVLGLVAELVPQPAEGR